MSSKYIYFEPVGRIHSTHWELIHNPPEGYKFVIRKTALNNMSEWATLSNKGYIFLKILSAFFPPTLTKTWIEKFYARSYYSVEHTRDACLTYSINHVVFRKEPWVVHIEWPHMLVTQLYTPINVYHFYVFRSIIRRLLTSNYCKRILTWSSIVKREILSKLGYDLESKIELVPLSTTRKHFIKSYNHDKVRILFIGSAYGPQSNDFFWLKGGREVFKVFEILNKEYRNLELVVRSVVPPEIKRRYQRYPNVRIIDYIIPREKLEFEFKRADIFLFPGHHTPFGVILEAMSYELPVVVIDNCWANSELIEDGVTGFVVDSPMLRLFRERGYAQLPVSSFLKLIRTPDPELVKKLSQKIGLLIQDENLRKKMGRNARREVEVGRYSIAHRNMILKKIFDEITE